MSFHIRDLSEPVQAHFAAPHAATIEPDMVVARAGRVTDGTVIEIAVRFVDDHCHAAAFRAFGCPSAIACGSWLAEWLPGKSITQAEAMTGLMIAQQLALVPEKTGIALLAEDALRAVLTHARLAAPCTLGR